MDLIQKKKKDWTFNNHIFGSTIHGPEIEDRLLSIPP